MRFKQGSKVEVLSQKEVPGGAWRCAVIVSGNGHTYSVSYDWSGKDSQAIVQRVSRKDIRPCPPPVQRMEIWAVGDVAEVFDVGFWKMATVLKVLDENYYLARVLGSFEEFRVHKYRIRARQLWNDDKWVGIGKGPDNRMSLQVRQMNAKIKLPARNNRLPSLYNISCQDSHSVSSGSLKRASPYSSSVEGYSQKMRAIEKGCEHQRVFSGSPSYLLKKVDAVAYPRENLGEKDMHTSFINRTTGCVEKEREKLNGVISCFVERSSELNDTDSDACSVGSCSVISSSSNKLFGHNVAGTSQDADTLSSDAESFCCCEDAQENLSLPLKEDVAAGIHRLELNAYRSTLVAMHASGSLSWEQEALLTNLRISLHISNDEHLMEGQGWSLAWLALLPKAKMILGFIILVCTQWDYLFPIFLVYDYVTSKWYNGFLCFLEVVCFGSAGNWNTSCTKQNMNFERFPVCLMQFTFIFCSI